MSVGREVVIMIEFIRLRLVMPKRWRSNHVERTHRDGVFNTFDEKSRSQMYNTIIRILINPLKDCVNDRIKDN